MSACITAHRGAGCKLASDCWRTINGQHYEAWLSYPSADRIVAYRAAGVRCRRFGEELFVHTLDTDKASEVDAALSPPLSEEQGL